MAHNTFGKLASYEQGFAAKPVVNGVAYKLTPTTLTSSDGSASVDVVRCRRADGGEAYFSPKRIPKARICLHFTVGNVRSDVYTLAGTSKVSVPFLVARDGTVYEFFDSHFWAYHLGKNSRYDNLSMSAVSVGIEISNYGPLTPAGSVLNNAYKSAYCSLDQTDAYVELGAAYRGYRYFASYTDAQIEAVGRLLRYLGAEHQIPLSFLPEARRNEVLDDLSKEGPGTAFLGVCSHVNFRPDKFDLGPAFAWDTLISEVSGSRSDAGGGDHPSSLERMATTELPAERDHPELHIDPHHRHEVHQGDTLAGIAAQHHTSVQALVDLNGLTDRHLIEVGMVLAIPPDSNTIVVQKGDTLWGLAKLSGVPTDVLAHANDIADSSKIEVGQVLTVPR